MNDDDPLFGYASCPRCGSGNLARTETPVRTSPLDGGATLRQWSRVVVCVGCSDTVYEKKYAERVDPPPPPKPAGAAATDEKSESADPKPAERDRYSLLDVD